ncbi:NUDIX hydrolase [Bacillus cihuensis]|uniref:hypothetical protein n=1 Tax=Bacillus cihuensis TaxID=1208599 RepID=UPI00041C3FE1|nr:hypothetical protein [Bacillus cihuensis]
MSKYTVEIKIQAVERYLTGNESYKTIAECIGTTTNPDSHQVGLEWIYISDLLQYRIYPKELRKYIIK